MGTLFTLSSPGTDHNLLELSERQRQKLVTLLAAKDPLYKERLKTMRPLMVVNTAGVAVPGYEDEKVASSDPIAYSRDRVVEALELLLTLIDEKAGSNNEFIQSTVVSLLEYALEDTKDLPEEAEVTPYLSK